MRKRNVRKSIVGMLLLTVLILPALIVPTVAEANPGGEKGIISVYGETVITAQPDLARVVLAVETTDAAAQTAAAENARLTNAVLEALEKAGLDKKQLKTSGYRLDSYEEQVDPQNKDKYITIYRAYNELKVSLHNLDKMGDVIDTAIRAGANRVLYVSFEIRDAEALKLQALQNATTQAKAKADAIARSAGLTIKGIKVINEEMSGYQPYRAAAGGNYKMMEDLAPTPILPGDVEVTARVRAEYYF